LAYVLSPTIPQADLLAFSVGLADIARDYPDASEAALPRGLAEIGDLEGAIEVVNEAEASYRAEQGDEAVAGAEVDRAMQALVAFWDALRDKVWTL
jgi:hypothetical protein